MDDKSFRLWAEMDESGTPGNPWGGMARDYHRETGSPIEDCVDRVILRYLRSGVVHPLTDLFEHKLSLGPKVLRYLSQMLEPSVSTEEEMPYRFEVKRRSGIAGAVSDPSIDERDRLIYEHAVHLGAKKRGYRERAVKAAINMFEPDHRPSFDAALKAYKKYHKISFGK